MDIIWLVDFNSYLFHVWLLVEILNFVMFEVVDIIPLLTDGWLNNNGIVIEWVGVIEVFIRYDWLSSPSWLNNRCWLHNDEVIVWIVVLEVGIAQVSSGGGRTDLGDGWIFYKDWEVVIWIVIIEVSI